MAKTLVIKSLQRIVVAYIEEANRNDELHAIMRQMVAEKRNFGHYLDPANDHATGCVNGKLKSLDGEYQQICERFRLYERFGLPHFLGDLRRHVLLVDEILNGTLFLQ